MIQAPSLAVWCLAELKKVGFLAMYNGYKKSFCVNYDGGRNISIVMRNLCRQMDLTLPTLPNIQSKEVDCPLSPIYINLREYYLASITTQMDIHPCIVQLLSGEGYPEEV